MDRFLHCCYSPSEHPGGKESSVPEFDIASERWDDIGLESVPAASLLQWDPDSGAAEQEILDPFHLDAYSLIRRLEPRAGGRPPDKDWYQRMESVKRWSAARAQLVKALTQRRMSTVRQALHAMAATEQQDLQEVELVLHEGDKIGIGVISVPELAVLEITLVRYGGALHCWNHEHPGFEVTSGDYILEVNGLKGLEGLEAMAEEAKAARRLRLLVRRTPSLSPCDLWGA